MSYTSKIVALLIVAVTLCSAVTAHNAAPKHIGFVLLPEHGHFQPAAAIAEELLRRGHHVTLYMTGATTGSYLNCNTEAATFHPAPSCITVVTINKTITPEMIEEIVLMSPLDSLKNITVEVDGFNRLFGAKFLEYLEQDGVEKPDALLVDFGVYSGAIVAEKLNIPAVMLWPLVLQMPLQLHPSIPALTLAQSIHMNVGERIANYLYQRFLVLVTLLSTSHSELRTLLGAKAADIFQLYQRHHVITPSVFGLDIAQPLCPNVHPVGLLRRSSKAEGIPADVADDWQTWLARCTGGVIYINMGSVSRMPKTWVHRIENASHAFVEDGYCVLWKLYADQQHKLRLPLPRSSTGPLRIVSHIPFSPTNVLKHQNTKVFVTHCGDTSVYESLEYGVPLVGIPMFADQADMCARVEDAGIGTRLEKFTFTAATLKNAVKQMVGNEHASSTAKRLAKMGLVQGGGRRAADVIEMIALHPELESSFYCPHYDLPWYQLLDIDVTLVVSFVLFVLLSIIVSILKCMWRCVVPTNRRAPKQKKE